MENSSVWPLSLPMVNNLFYQCSLMGVPITYFSVTPDKPEVIEGPAAGQEQWGWVEDGDGIQNILALIFS